MKIIDAHLHLFTPGDYTGPVPAGKLSETYGRLNVCAGIVMGNQPLSPDAYNFPPAFRYCVGVGDFERSLEADEETLAVMEEHLRRPQCVGIKIYTGYAPIYAGDPRLEPYYRLAGKHGKAVAFHTGMTAGSMGRLKYSHPLTLDDVASAFPDVQFVMCHFGNPFLSEAAAVMEKNPNVAADLSGLLDGVTELDGYFARQSGYIEQLRTWMNYVDDDSRFMFGTDYPAVDIGNYVDFISRLVGEERAEKVFFDNANRIYRLGL
jgi:predicted TIM-barrel fold metal-dependent hydrolase